MTDDERKNIPSENLVCERYLAKFGYLDSISVERSSKYFKAKRIRDNLMFDALEKKEDIEKSSWQIMKSLKSMKVYLDYMTRTGIEKASQGKYEKETTC